MRGFNDNLIVGYKNHELNGSPEYFAMKIREGERQLKRRGEKGKWGRGKMEQHKRWRQANQAAEHRNVRYVYRR